jgi:hypothetical protein
MGEKLKEKKDKGTEGNNRRGIKGRHAKEERGEADVSLKNDWLNPYHSK